MAGIKVIFGSTTGNTERVAALIQQKLEELNPDLINVSAASEEDFKNASVLILGAPTWNEGELQEDWDEFLPVLDQVDLHGKKIALFGLGDAQGYADEFVNGLRRLYEKVVERGARVIGFWPAEDYEFTSSTALEGDKFVGLVLDEDNEPDKTEGRIQKWIGMIEPEIRAG